MPRSPDRPPWPSAASLPMFCRFPGLCRRFPVSALPGCGIIVTQAVTWDALLQASSSGAWPRAARLWLFSARTLSAVLSGRVSVGLAMRVMIASLLEDALLVCLSFVPLCPLQCRYHGGASGKSRLRSDVCLSWLVVSLCVQSQLFAVLLRGLWLWSQCGAPSSVSVDTVLSAVTMPLGLGCSHCAARHQALPPPQLSRLLTARTRSWVLVVLARPCPWVAHPLALASDRGGTGLFSGLSSPRSVWAWSQWPASPLTVLLSLGNEPFLLLC